MRFSGLVTSAYFTAINLLFCGHSAVLAVVLLWFSVAFFGVRVFILCLFILLLSRFGLLSSHLLGKSCSLG